MVISMAKLKMDPLVMLEMLLWWTSHDLECKDTKLWPNLKMSSPMLCLYMVLNMVSCKCK
jgi:hypothetical protein